ncbi:MAG: YkvA family protein [Methanosphaera sp.]
MSKFIYFYETIRENLDSYDGEYDSFIDYGPNLFKLLCDILDHNTITNRHLRLEISAAIAYYAIPRDLIPEETYGPKGYVDDILISTYVLKNVANEYGYEILQDSWAEDSNVKEIIEECYNKSTDILEDKVYPILSYIGLRD